MLVNGLGLTEAGIGVFVKAAQTVAVAADGDTRARQDLAVLTGGNIVAHP